MQALDAAALLKQLEARKALLVRLVSAPKDENELVYQEGKLQATTEIIALVRGLTQEIKGFLL